jgi:hypothetical protein
MFFALPSVTDGFLSVDLFCSLNLRKEEMLKAYAVAVAMTTASPVGTEAEVQAKAEEKKVEVAQEVAACRMCGGIKRRGGIIWIPAEQTES